jgi:hypothetical protein
MTMTDPTIRPCIGRADADVAGTAIHRRTAPILTDLDWRLRQA